MRSSAGGGLRTAAPRAVGAGVLAAAAGGAGAVGAAAMMARKVVTPERERPDDVEILEVGTHDIVLAASEETIVPGRYGLWFGQSGHARLGQVLAEDHDRRTVRRVLLGIDAGELRPGGARWDSGFFGSAPDGAVGLATRRVAIQGPIGSMPAWHVPAAGSSRWAVMVHGRGATRLECVRAVPATHEKGWHALIPSYRNDTDAPAGPGGRYHLGMTEWHDVECAVRYAVDNGATDIALFGYSMGGAITLQFLDRSPWASRISRVVLDGPVIDWGDVLRYHARLKQLPEQLVGLSVHLLRGKATHRLAGVPSTIDLTLTDWVTRADEIHTPLLIIHSREDDFVPIGPSLALAQRRPDLVTVHEWRLARHCKEWNTDSMRWERLVRDFLD